MKIKILLPCVIICSIILNAYAQVKDKKAEGSVQNELRTDEIFDDIMQSLPADVRSRVDSIKMVSQKKSPSSFQNQSATELQTIKNKNFENVSTELKVKIEKAMKDIDLQKQKRQMQFKENKNK
jgi:hypothetical protein